MKTVAMLLAGGEGSRLTVLSEKRAKPAVPFAGKFRIIDFTLSNCVNSGINTVGVLTQYRPHSLSDHIGIGKPWNLDRNRGGVRILSPYQERGGQHWYAGTADAIYQNLGLTSKWPDGSGLTGKANIENSSGFGFGLGAEFNWDPVGLYGQAVYYPCMITKNVGLDGNPDGKLNVWEWDLGLRTNFKDSPIQAKIGYHFEQHSASNLKLKYDGIQIGATAEF